MKTPPTRPMSDWLPDRSLPNPLSKFSRSIATLKSGKSPRSRYIPLKSGAVRSSSQRNHLQIEFVAIASQRETPEEIATRGHIV
ncbi:MAG: hypothetical protein D6728_17335 [Cyanobacteria bacterium J055]|nr:MAG: hypothetical protein D6728_17335 [Cyanobacteria bacterium J055]